MSKKLSILTVILLSLFIIISCQQKIDIETEKEAIKKVIENETKLFYDGNYEEFANTWVHEPYALWTSVGNNYHNEFIGWDSIGVNLKRFMDARNEPFTDEVIRKNFSYRIYGNGAWVTFEQHYKSSMDKNPEHLPGRALRVLEKTDSGWKMVFMGGIDRNSYKEQNVENDLNNVGYKLLGQEKIKDAIEIFKMNVKMYPESSNVYDSLGEAYMKDDNKELAIKNYEKSLELDPKNDNTKKMIEELKK